MDPEASGTTPTPSDERKAIGITEVHVTPELWRTLEDRPDTVTYWARLREQQGDALVVIGLIGDEGHDLDYDLVRHPAEGRNIRVAYPA